MPIIKIQHVFSVSSEDTNHPADNLLSSETYRKWKCAAAGEKKAVVVLQLDKSTQVHSVDIGNEGSAFVEVLLGRSSNPETFEVLLGMSTFMTPSESKAWSNTNRVRMFGKDKFAKEVYEQKWDRVKIVCTQPYNKKEQYGLSFIKLHSPPGTEETIEETSKQPTKLGAFSLKEETEDIPTGSLFFKKEPSSTSSSSGGLSVAAQARAATTEALKGTHSESPTRKTVRAESTSKGKETAQNKKRIAESAKESPPTKKTKVSGDPPPLTGKTLPFNELMAGVVFSLSGFKNPFRASLRGKAVDMGAKFQPDWTPACTHLVCAFPDTPKFNQVKAKGGLIVAKEWITDSYVKKRRFPAKKYRLSAGNDKEYDDKEEAIFGRPEGGTKLPDKAEKAVTSSSKGTEDDIYGGSTDEESESEVKMKPHPLNDSSECDTEDEIEKAKEKKVKKADSAEDPYGGSMDEEDTGGGTSSDPKLPSLSALPDLFSKCTFLLYGDFSPADCRLIKRYITAYNGHIVDYMSENVSHVISMEKWDNQFDQALSENSRLAFVKPQWIFVCHQKQTCVPYQPYIIVPK